ncbi:HAD-IB family hydrolase [Parvimonas micra]|uniref:HAD family hydrolase n=1 Tax=Parvimonas TaxID=543311 RepID=UPI0002DBB884|nr:MULTISPECIES: HAD-IB family hydrolase [unclassified Parvimonas]MBF1295837.1 HAD-IB family hydrolase [Parvimonas sp.]MBF1299525.1 HAD-IB family hydrolase [Parvimonas sp.]MEB3012415.1 HAD-IB family hydrolase [Parvimonas sp. D2]MEB3087909.1 HAD-IB family hydrolase [Parvimonas sp. D4]
MGNIAAFFDIDGTIARESLMIEHFKRLIKYEILDESVWVDDVKQLYMEYVNRYGAYDAYIEALSEKYRSDLRGFDIRYNKFIAEQSIKKVFERVYVFSRNQLEFHKANGHLIFFISGSPDFLVKEMAEKYDVTEFRATKYLFDENGKFTGEIVPMWHSEGKDEVCNEIIEKYNIDVEKSYAYGDTTGDLSMLRRFGNAYTINPSNKLLQRIKNDEELSKKVNIIVERKDVIYKLKADVTTL